MLICNVILLNYVLEERKVRKRRRRRRKRRRKYGGGGGGGKRGHTQSRSHELHGPWLWFSAHSSWANVPLHLLTLEILSEEKPQNLFLLIGHDLDLEINISAKVCWVLRTLAWLAREMLSRNYWNSTNSGHSREIDISPAEMNRDGGGEYLLS